jgi:hypothetical protein
VDDLRAEAPGGSLRQLSRAALAAWITQMVGRPMPNEPGHPPAMKRTRSKPGVIKMIDPAHGYYIGRLLDQVFPTMDAAFAWLRKTFKVERIHDLGTAKRAGEVIRVLEQMRDRKKTPTTKGTKTTKGPGSNPSDPSDSSHVPPLRDLRALRGESQSVQSAQSADKNGGSR